MILLNSPYQGYATGSSSTTTQSSIEIVSGSLTLTSTTSSEKSSEINESDGSAGGSFELDTWTFYSTKTVAVYGDGPNEGCTQPYVAEITATSTPSYNAQLLPQGSETDFNEPTSVSFSGFSSVVFHNGWNASMGASSYIADCNQAFSYGLQTTNVISAGVTLSFGSDTVTGTLTETVSSTQAFTYYFPANGYWYIQFSVLPVGLR
ncbi:MAG: hypothetical protein QXG05_08300 [Nitrososphaerota archaeon]